MILIREEKPEDYLSVYEVNKRSFETSAEADLVNKLRSINEQIISIVAINEKTVVGHVFFTPVVISGKDSGVGAMALGPIAVAPEFQRKGIGSQLVKNGLTACKKEGAQAVFLLGHPEFYIQFGFQLAKEKGFRYKSADFDPYFLVSELIPGALKGISGDVIYMPEFDEV